LAELLAAGGFRLSGDLGGVGAGVVLVLLAFTTLLVVREGFRAVRARLWVGLSGVVSATLLALAVLRPVSLSEVREPSAARVTVLVDASERSRLPLAGGGDRGELVSSVLRSLEKNLRGSRLQTLGFGEGRELPPLESMRSRPPSVHSDFEKALETLEGDPAGPPAAVVVVGDGRLTAVDSSEASSALGRARSGVPVHTVRLLDAPLHDRSLVRVAMPDSVVAHEPFRLDVELGCFGGASCERVPLTVHELLQGGQKELRAEATPELSPGSQGKKATASLRLTLDRAGPRVIEISVGPDAGDEVPENNRRILEVNVRRDRLRLLHVAGRPTYDVRALRTFLKADRSVDLVAFFILRTATDHVMAPSSELALIPFPVDELFSEHLPSFDAVILQDIDALEYGVAAHFRSLRDYVKKGGGIVLVGGPSMFAAGGYSDSPLAEVMPVQIRATKKVADLTPFVPNYTRLGQAAPPLSALRALLGERLPEAGGTNLVGPPERGAYVLWEHPNLPPVGGSAEERMPLLALREVGDGRSIALTLDSTHKLRFGPEGLESAGRAHTAFWEGMLGWLMRDARFELAQARAPWPCISGRPFRIEVEPLVGNTDSLTLSLEALGRPDAQSIPKTLESEGAGERTVTFDFPGLEPGGYAALVRVGKAPPLRFVFACEAGGEAWADSRPDPERLRGWSQARAGLSVSPAEVGSIPIPEGTSIIAKSVSVPLLPDAAWSTLAAIALGIHWLLRRYGGLL
jgi:uncharacterized membrane protein